FYTKGNIDLLKKELGLQKNSKSYLPEGTMTLLKNSDEKYEKAFKLLEMSKYPIKRIISPLQDFKQAYLFEGEAFNNPMETLELIRKKIVSFCEVKEGVNVTAIEGEVLKTNIGDIPFEKVFVATNFGLTELLKLEDEIKPKR